MWDRSTFLQDGADPGGDKVDADDVESDGREEPLSPLRNGGDDAGERSAPMS